MNAAALERKLSSLKGRTIIGLTGPIASGKSLALACFAKEGALAISTDAVSAKVLTEPACYNRILHRFGRKAILNNGSLDKERLAAAVFRSPAERKWLENLLHPEILNRVYSLILKSKKKIAVVEAPLLFEAGLPGCFNLTLCLAAPENTLKERALARGWTPAQYEARKKAQLSAQRKYALADLVLENGGDKKALAKAIRNICRFIEAAGRNK